VLFFVSVISKAQVDEMKTDIGITRGRNIHLWPVFYRDKNSDNKKILAVASLYEYQRNYKDSSVYTHFLPFYIYDSSSIRKSLRIGTIYYPTIFRREINFRNEIRTTKFLELFPNIDLIEFTRSKSGDYLKNNLLFFLWYKNDLINNKSHLVLFPIYWKLKNQYKSSSLLFPLFFYHKDTLSKESKTWIFPSVFIRKEWQKKTFSFLPFFAYRADQKNNKSNLMLSLFIWRIKEEDSKLNILFPVYWRKRNNSSFNPLKRTVLFPFYFSRKEKNLYSNPLGRSWRNNVIFPFYWNYHYASIKNNQVKDSSHFFAIMPFGAYGKSSFNNKRIWAITPLIWSIKEPKSKLDVAFPIYWKRRKSSKDDSLQKTVIFPFYFSKDERHVYSYKNKNSHDTTINITHSRTIFPFYWNYNSSSIKNKVLKDSAKYISLMPFYGKGSRYDFMYPQNTIKYYHISPLYWVVRSENKLERILFPLWWYKKGENSNYNVLFPLWWSGKRGDSKHHVLFPVYWNINNKNVHANTILPFYYYKKDKLNDSRILAISPFFGSIRKQNFKTSYLLPFWFYSNTDNYSSFTIFPFISAGKSKIDNSSSHLVITPLFWRTKNKNQSTTFLFPLFEHNRNFKTNRVKTNFGLFLYRYSKADSSFSHNLIWPLIKYSKSTAGFEFHISPIVWIKKTKENSFFGILPFYYKAKSENFVSYNLLWQLYSYKRMKGFFKRHSILGPVYLNCKYDDGNYENRFLYLIYANCNMDGKKVKSLFPFYYIQSDSIGNYSNSYGLSFYNNFKRKVPNTTEFYKEVKIFWFLRLRSNYNYLKEKGIEIDRRKIRSR
jgi:hypothetical protein